MKKIFIILAICFFLSGCSNNSSGSEIKKLMKEDNYIIIDVRTEDEFTTSHISGAINIPYDEIGESSNIDKDKTIFVYCRSGTRSKIAFDKLTKLGYKVYDLGAFSEINLPKE